MFSCRSCEGELGTAFLTLGASPLSNSYLSAEALKRMEPTYPLDVYLCERCHLVQIDEFERAEAIFNEEYAYFSGFSESWLKHCQAYQTAISDRLGLDSRSFVVEVASNDGYLLQYFSAAGIPCLGVEPAANVAEAARAKGIETDVEFFGRAYAADFRERGLSADLVIGNNVLAHNPNVNDFVAGLHPVLAPTGVVTMEFPHLLRMIAENQFDTIYHEHFCYLSLHAVTALFERHGLTLFDVDELPTHGGSLRIYAQRTDSPKRPIASNIAAVLDAEREAGLLGRAAFEAFAERVITTKHALLKFLIEARENGKRVVGYGAPAKGNTLLNFCGIRTDLLKYTVDRSPHKQGRFLPGTRIPVYAPERIHADRPDYVLILPWNIKDEIMEQNATIREWGGRFVVPIPYVQVI